MKKDTWNKLWIGIVVGLLGAMLGFILFGIGFCWVNNCSFSYFIHDVFLGVQDFQSRIISFSMLIDVVLFFVLVRKDWHEMAKGMMAVMVLSVPVVAWLY